MTRFSQIKTVGLSLVAGVIFMTPSANANGPVALVEYITVQSAGIGFMDFLSSGRTFNLGQNGQVVLGYFQSCIKETIKGGSVQVGARQSQVTDGKVKRVRVECDGGRLVLSPEQAGKSAVTVFRKAPSKDKKKLPKASLTVYSTVPLVSLTEKSEKLNIYRLDQSAQMYSVTVDGLVADLAKKKLSFEPGGLYKISTGSREVIVKVDPLADDGASSILQRLIRL